MLALMPPGKLLAVKVSLSILISVYSMLSYLEVPLTQSCRLLTVHFLVHFVKGNQRYKTMIAQQKTHGTFVQYLEVI